MALEIAIEVASKVADLLIVPAGRQIDYAWNCKEHTENLRGEVKKLKEARERLQRQVRTARKRGEKIETDIEEWLKVANQFIESADEFLQAEDQVNKKCFGVLCPDCRTWYQRGRKAKKWMLHEAAALCKRKDEIDVVSYHETPQVLRPLKVYETFDSRIFTVKEIMQALADPKVSKIGLYGINGVGKTTLAREIARQAKEENLFDEVVMANVFQDQSINVLQGETDIVKQTPDIRRIQGEIAEGLGFQFHFETERGRAAELHERLKDESRKLLVLDNIWTGIELDDLGIPCNHEGCKILMTSTNQKVLSLQMASQNNFLLDTLPSREAWDWFKRMVGDRVLKDPSLEEVASQVSDRCAGLPILLVPVAKGLKNTADLDEWKEALTSLSSFDKDEMHAHVDSALQLSYNLLAGHEIKSVFLLCGQVHPIDVQYLLKYAFGLGFLKQCNTLEKGRFRILKLVNDLKDSCLLLEGSKPEEVKMHEIVRNFAVSIASRDHDVFTVGLHNSLQEWPGEDILENLTAVSLNFCDIPDLPEVFKCPKLESFILSNKDPSIEIPDNFFGRMKKLKVLDLTNIHFSQLPSSLQILKDLRTLCLDWCVLKDIQMIGKLKKLQVLSLSGSDIIRLPKEIGKLSCLQLLDLSHCKRLEVIPPNLLSSLAQLEELRMENTFLQWEFEGVNIKGANASLAELNHLRNLNTLDVHIVDAKLLPKSLFSKNLERFRIFIGDGWNWSSEYRTSRTLKVKLATSIQWERGLKGLLKRTEDLYLDELKGIQSSLNELDSLGFRQLKHLHIENSSEIQYIVNSTEMRPYAAFTKLESLFLDNLPNLKKICEGQLVPESFSNLRMLEVVSCGALENVISSTMARGLLRLEEIKIADCRSLKEIITEESKDETDADEEIKLPRVRKLVLDSLPQFSRFCSSMNGRSMSETRKNIPETSRRLEEVVHEIETETPTPLLDQRIPFPNLKELKLSSIITDKIWDDQIVGISSCVQNLTSLTVDGCNNLKSLFSSLMVGSLISLKTLLISNCRMMEQIIITEEFGEGTSQVTFRQLDLLRLENLPELTQVCVCYFFECPALKELSIMKCPALRMFVSKPGEENEAVSNKDEQTNFPVFDEKVAFPNLEELQTYYLLSVNMIWHNKLHDGSFSKLKRLSVSNVPSLVQVFPSNYVLSRLQNVETLSIECCCSLEEIFGFDAIINSTHFSVATKLKTLEIKLLQNLNRIWSKGAAEVHFFHNLHKIDVSDCPNLEIVFPGSMVGGLLQLTFVRIVECGVEEIVSVEEGKELIADFDFPQLTYLELWKLPKLKSLYPGSHTSTFPKLKYLRVSDCAQIEVFSESQDFQEKYSKDEVESSKQPILSAEKVIPNLEEVPLNINDAAMLFNGSFPTHLFGNAKLLFLQCFEDESTSFPSGLIQKFNNLEQLVIIRSCFKEIFPDNGFADEVNQGKNLEKIRLLRLDFLYNLKQIKLDHFLKKLEILEVVACDNLTILAPPFTSFKTLKVLKVWNCSGLIKLVTSSTAESLVQLTDLSVEYCKGLKEIIENEGADGSADLTFHKLRILRLDCLTNLTNFCSSICSLRFLSLEEVILKKCPKMVAFSPGDLHVPKLRTVKTEGRDKVRWMGDLNATVLQLHMQLAGFDGLRQLKLSEFPKLKGRWPDQLPVAFFDQLNSLTVDECAFCLWAVPSNLFLSMKFLEDLEVRNCKSVEEVFDIGQPDTPESTKYLSQLSKFRLVDLPSLKHVWNENAEGILKFNYLKHITIQNCGSLTYIFTLSMLSSTNSLEHIEVKSCHKVKEIIAKDVERDAGINRLTWNGMNSITLEDLPNLTHFYAGSGIIEFPSLEMLAVVDCSVIFTCMFLNGFESTYNLAEAAFPNLKKLRVVWDDVIGDLIRLGLYRQLAVLELIRFTDDHETFPCHILRRLPNLENLGLSNATFEEIALHEETSDEENRFQLAKQIKELKLSKLPKLTCLLKDSGSHLVLQNFECLRVSECVNLKFLVPSSVSFKCLTVLEVSKCNGLISLIFSPTARSLLQLTMLGVSDCEMMMGIIAEKEKVAGNDIIFRKLKCLRLQSLPSLIRFYSGKYALVFPILEEVYLSECPKLKAFSEGDVKMPKLKKLQLPEGEDKGYWESSHYAHIQQLFIKMKQPVAQTKSLSLPRQQYMVETTHVEEEKDIIVTNDIASRDLQASKITNSGEDDTAQCETTDKVTSEEETTMASLREIEIIDVTLNSPNTLNNKKSSTEGEGIPCNSMENHTRISEQNFKDGEAAMKDEVYPDASTMQNEASEVYMLHSAAVGEGIPCNSMKTDARVAAQNVKDGEAAMKDEEYPDTSTVLNKASDVSQLHFAVVEEATVSVGNTISHQELIDVTTTKPPPSQIAEMSAHSAAHFEHLFVSTGKVPEPTSSSKLASSSITNDDLPESISLTPEHTYLDHAGLLKNILIKPLSEVSRSHDVHILLSTLENLKNCAHLNYQQSEIIRYYIEHFDTLVTYHSFYEDEIGRASALELSVQDDMKGMPELKILFDNLTNKAVSLSADKEILKKKLLEVEEEEEKVRSDMESLRAKLVSKNMKQDALPKASMRQKEAEDKARSGNDHWTKIRNLFA